MIRIWTVFAVLIIPAGWVYAIDFPESFLLYQERATTEENAEVLNGAVTVVNEIVSRFPEKDYFYLGIGQEPSLLMAIMQTAGIEARTFPISKANEWSSTDLSDPEFTRRLQTLIDQFIVSRIKELKIPAQRKLLMIDFQVTGETLKAVKSAVQKRLRGRHLNHKIETLALAYNTVPLSASIDHRIHLNPYYLLEGHLYASDSMHYSEFGTVDIRVKDSEFEASTEDFEGAWSLPSPRPVYQEMKNFLREVLQIDEAGTIHFTPPCEWILGSR